MALLVEFVDEAFHRDLVTIKDIRNAFAHKLSVSDFNSESVRNLSNNLKIVETHSYEIASMEEPTTDMLDHRVGLPNRNEILADPRQRFLLAVQLFALHLSLPKKPGQSVNLYF